ncbi:MAG: ChrR family anti-sigma-E factor [Pseudomonadota bacterium]|nr:ChrR family anti-sigma-E factor [Pseudomonadota bacterium]
MSATHHPDDATLLSYAAGTLDEAFVLLVASHLAGCAECHARVRLAENVGGSLLEQAETVALSAGALDRAFARIELAPERLPIAAPVASAELPVPLASKLGAGLDSIAWRVVAPGVRMHSVPLSAGTRGALHLLRIDAGKHVPEHGHGGMELTLVLRGSYSDAFGRFRPGDVADLDPDAEHCPVVDPDGECICAVATEAPTRFRGVFSRLLQPLVGI